MPRFPLLLLTAVLLTGCATQSAASRPDATAAQPSGTGLSSLAELDALTIPPLPSWVDKYADEMKGDMRFFNISRLMERFQLGRAQAVELQNHYRDQTRATPGLEPVTAFNTALERVRRGEYESRLDLERLGKARFIVAFDLDDTLWDQYYPPDVGAACHDVAVQEEKPASQRYIKLVPGWQQAFERIQALGGAVVLFSANLDDSTLQGLNQWKMNGTALTQSPALAGILTNSHLILQDKSEGVSDPRKGSPVREPSKDLRIFDEQLRRVIIVDDNPTRLFQMRNSRIFKKFAGASSCTTTDPVLRRAIDGAMPVVVREIEDSVRYMDQHGGDFADAYLPFTSLGQVTVRYLIDSGGLDQAQAVDYVRRNPKAVDSRY